MSRTKNKEKKAREPKKKPEAEREVQFYRSATGDRTINYRVYHMSKLERILYFLLAFAVGAGVGFLFYGGLGKDQYGDPTTVTYIINIVVMLLCGALAGKFFVPIRNGQILKKRQNKLKVQFRDMLEALTTALGSGMNVRESFSSVFEDLKNQYDDNAFIIQELAVLNNGLANGINLEELLSDFAKRSGNEDICDFAEVFDICYRRGGNIKDTIQNTCQIISDKMSVMEEIETTVSGSKNEQYIMLVMPVLLIAMIKFSSPDFAANFATPAGIIATTIGIVTFVASFFLGKKLLDIKV